jgi:hypothetical protein
MNRIPREPTVPDVNSKKQDRIREFRIKVEQMKTRKIQIGLAHRVSSSTDRHIIRACHAIKKKGLDLRGEN